MHRVINNVVLTWLNLSEVDFGAFAVPAFHNLFGYKYSDKRANAFVAKHGNNAVVTCEIKLFQGYSSLRRRPSEVILSQRVETCRNYFSK